MLSVTADAHAFRVTLHLVSKSLVCPRPLRNVVRDWERNDWDRSKLSPLDYEVIYAHCDDKLVQSALAEWDVDTSQIRDYAHPCGAGWYAGEASTDCKLCGHKNNRFEFPLINESTGTTIWTGSTCIVKYGVTVDGDGCAETAHARLRGEIAKAKRKHAATVWAKNYPDAPARLDALREHTQWLSRKWLPYSVTRATQGGKRVWTSTHEHDRKRLGKWARAAVKYFDKHAMLTPKRTGELIEAVATLHRLRGVYADAEANTPVAKARAEWTPWLDKHASVLSPAERERVEAFVHYGYTRADLYSYNRQLVEDVERRLSPASKPATEAAEAAGTKEALDALPW